MATWVGAVLVAVAYALARRLGAPEALRSALLIAVPALTVATGALVAARTARRAPALWLSGAALGYGTAVVLYVLRSNAALAFPSIADVVLLASYVGMVGGFVALVREDAGPQPRALWLDTTLAGLALATLVVAAVFRPRFGTDARSVADAAQMVYAIGDLFTLGFIGTACVLAGLRPAPRRLVVVAGVAVLTVADAHYALAVRAGHLTPGTLHVLAWQLGPLLFAASPLAPRAAAVRPRGGTWALVAIPAGAAAIALPIAVVSSVTASLIQLLLALSVLSLVVVRLLVSLVALRRAEDRLRHQSLHDPLTGLPNRALLVDRLHHALAAGRRRPGEHQAVLVLDVDHFKTINDTLGHEAGDEVLRALAPRLVAALRAGDTLARFGGDEFVALCEGLEDTEEALGIAQRLLGAAQEPFVLGGHEHFLTLSVGVAMNGPAYADQPEALVRDADAAMYRAKAGGRGRSELFDDVLRARLVSRLRLERELRRATPAGELELHFQPLAGLAGDVAPRVEALVRWRHPQRGLVGPGEFIPAAEETGLIAAIGEWVLGAACEQAVRWRDGRELAVRDVRMSVNVSARQLVRGDLVTVVADALARTGLDPCALVLEITESTLVEDPAVAAVQLGALHRLGVGLALDDFGTGYSSLVSLRQFPLHAVKLDRSFVAGLTRRGADAAIVAGVVQMAHSLGLSTIAEGVETEAQLAAVRTLGCDFAQGYLFAPPLGADAALAYLAGARVAAG